MQPLKSFHKEYRDINANTSDRFKRVHKSLLVDSYATAKLLCDGNLATLSTTFWKGVLGAIGYITEAVALWGGDPFGVRTDVLVFFFVLFYVVPTKNVSFDPVRD